MKQLCIVLLLVVAAANDAQDVLYGRLANGDKVIWLPANAAVDAAGKLRTDRFDESAQRRFRDHQQRNRDYLSEHPAAAPLCYVELNSLHAPPTDLGTLVDRSQSVIVGRIVERSVGFLFDRPSALLTVRIDDELRVSPDLHPNGDRVLLAYPDAELQVAGETFCAVPFSHRARPRVGDRVLIFAVQPPSDSSGRLIYTDASKHLVFETVDGVLIPPANMAPELARDGIGDLDELVAVVKARAQRR
ncbi:MAG TPA: hypothetical protein VGF69_01100 [Thermoanaerobaculia bacterium]|jgi:hypothetical protein